MASPACLWKVDGLDVSVALSVTVLGELRARIAAVGPLGPIEVGGILWGRTGKVAGEPRTCVDAFEALPIEHRSGPSYTLSSADRRQLERKLTLRRRDRLVPVGLWRSHLRRGLYLDQRDFDLFARLFHNPSAVFLLIHRAGTDAPMGGLFVWEGNDVRRHQSYLEFPLEGLPVAAEAARMDPVVAPARKWRLTGAVLKLPESVPKVSTAHMLRAAMYLIAVGMPLTSFYLGRQAAHNQYRGGVEAPKPVVAPPPVQLPDPKPSPLAEPIPFVPNLTAPPPDSRDRSAPVRVAGPPRRLEIPHPASRPEPAPAPALPEPPPVAQAAPLAAAPRILNLAPSVPSRHVETIAYIKPAPRSGFRKAMRKIPLLRGIGGSNATQGFVPANPVAEPLPALPEQEISGKQMSVELVAKIDRDGSVANVKFSNGNNQLTDASASALSRWRFEPARQDGEPVESDMLVRFEFRKRP